MSWANGESVTRKGEVINSAVHRFACDRCARVYLSNAGLLSNKKGHIDGLFINPDQYNIGHMQGM